MTSRITRLAPEHPFEVVRVPVSWYVDRIERGEFFSYTKINHRFWELEQELRAGPIPEDETDRADADATRGRRFYLETRFREELLEILASLPIDDPDFLFATSHVGYPDSDRIEGVTRDPASLIELMRTILPAGLVPHDGMLWKAATISGEIRTLYDAVRPHRVVAVGPEWLHGLAETFRLPHFTLVEIPSRDARGQRTEILERIGDLHGDFRGDAVIYLFEAGTLAPWLIHRLHGALRDACLIDVGRALDVCHPTLLFRHNWGRVHRQQLHDNLGLADRRTRYSRRIFGTTGAPAGRTARADRVPVEPARPVEWTRRLQPTGGSMRSDPGGHVVRLEAGLCEYLDLCDGLRVVATSSSTTALHALACLEQQRSARPLRWVTSALAAPATRRGPYAAARVLDCDAHGLLDYRALERLDPTSWDGVILTDSFGWNETLEATIDLCHRLGRRLVVDGSAALDTPQRRRAPISGEVLAFDAFRPWGAGEGGAAIVHRDHEAALRSIVAGRSPSNGEARVAACPLSESAALRILDQLADMTSYGVRHHLQYRRIATFASEVGWGRLGPAATLEKHATPGHVSLLAPEAIPAAWLSAAPFELRRHAAPLDRSCHVAREIHARLVEVPCHPGMEAFTNAELLRALAEPIERLQRRRRSDRGLGAGIRA